MYLFKRASLNWLSCLGDRLSTVPLRAAANLNPDPLSAVAAVPRAWPSAGPAALLCFPVPLGTVFPEPVSGDVLKGFVWNVYLLWFDLFIHLLTVSLKWRLYYTNIQISFDIPFRPNRMFFSFSVLPDVA